MIIVLNEHEWAEDVIASRTLGKKPFETFVRIARYYLDEGYAKGATRNMLDSFLLSCDSSASLPKWSDTLDKALLKAQKHEAIQIDSIPITSAEIKRIEAIKSTQARRLAFTLLCLAKYWDLIIPLGDHWVNNKDTEIMKMANISTSIAKQSRLYHTLNELGMIQFSKKIDNTNVRVNFIEDGDVILEITDFRNLGYQYLKLYGADYIVCEECGITFKPSDKKVGRKQKYCKDCAVDIRIKQSVDSVMKQRDKKKIQKYS